MKWTKQELDILRSHWGEETAKKIAAKLPNRTEEGVRKKALQLGLPEHWRERNSEVRKALRTSAMIVDIVNMNNAAMQKALDRPLVGRIIRIFLPNWFSTELYNLDDSLKDLCKAIRIMEGKV